MLSGFRVTFSLWSWYFDPSLGRMVRGVACNVRPEDEPPRVVLPHEDTHLVASEDKLYLYSLVSAPYQLKISKAFRS